MALSHYDREEETLIAYFKQMLSEEVKALDEEALAEEQNVSAAPVAEPAAQTEDSQVMEPETAASEASDAPDSTVSQEQPSAESVEEAANRAMIEAQEQAEAEKAATVEAAQAQVAETSVQETETAAEAQAEEYDSAAEYAQESDYEDEYEREDEYAHEDYGYTPELQPKQMPKPEAELPYATPSSLQSLLEQVPAPAVQTATVAPEPQVEVAAAEPEVAVATVEEQAVVQEDTMQVQAQQVEPPPKPEGLEWENIETPNEFQALFFLARGVRFAVPLVDLGGIYECTNVTSLFGKPAWYKGISDVRGRKINVVDTLKWVKPDVKVDSEFKYIILLGDSLWSICCDELEGNRYLNKENVKWRQNAGNRPWLAGIVKKEMCALLHVNALVTMFGKGFDLKTLQDSEINES